MLAFIVAFTIYLHISLVSGDFLSDDFVHMGWLAAAQSQEGVMQWVATKFYTPLASGNFAYRPVAFASYALDWLLYGSNANGWHLSNLLLHLINAALVYALARRFAQCDAGMNRRFIGFASTAVFLAIPFAGETTFWPVGRFDLLACLFALGFLNLVLAKSTLSLLGALGCFLLALLSKESAMPMLVIAFMLVFASHFLTHRQAQLPLSNAFTTAVKTSLQRYGAVLVVASAYFLWRRYLFGSFWKVYPDSKFPATFDEFWNRVVTLKNIFSYAYEGLAFIVVPAVILLLAVWLIGIVKSYKQASIANLLLAFVLFVSFLMYLLAPATSFPILADTGEGTRNLYFAWLMFSFFSALILSTHRWRNFILCVAIPLAFIGQWRQLNLWQGASQEMYRLTSAVPALAATIGAEQYALLLLPDHLGFVPFVRNAQGGVVMPPRQTSSYLPKMAAFNATQFAEWEAHLADNTIGKLKGADFKFERSAFIGVYCWNAHLSTFVQLTVKPIVNAAKDWERDSLKEAQGAGCLLNSADLQTIR